MPQQVMRLTAVFAVVGIALILARYFLIPETFGELGHYRAIALDSAASHQKRYAGRQECALCHSDVEALRSASNHQTVSCEVCHGPAARHVAGPMEVRPVINRERGNCLLCHAYNPSRPSGFPQVDPLAHNAPAECIVCHSPHAPEPPEMPEDCSACHGQIARQKNLSHHAGLPCSTCHDAPDEHRISPRSVQPSVPEDRSFCGTCHGQPELEASGIPQVSLASHGERYLCWQCHYPHFPEIGR